MQEIIDACYWPTSGESSFVTAGSPVMLLRNNDEPIIVKRHKVSSQKRETTFCGSKNINWLCERGRPIIVSDVSHDIQIIVYCLVLCVLSSDALNV
jgi:hypothetical protein